MEKNYNDIAHIESWIAGKMKSAERQAFEAQLATDEALQQEVEAYRKIFSGFKAARQENFAAEVGKWTKQAKTAGAKKPMRSIHPANKKSGKVVPMKRAGNVRPLWQKLAIAAGIVLVIGAGAFWWMSRQYTDEKLVASAYVAPLSSNTMGGNLPKASDLEQKFQEAHRLFQEENYQAASAAMSVFIKELETDPSVFSKITYQFYLDNARWTKVLADFASGQVTEENMVLILGMLEKQSSSEYAEKVKEFREGLNSPWRK
ncbi:MAG: hypothetical protein AAB316_09550 [Bacteroidota bacterium]